MKKIHAAEYCRARSFVFDRNMGFLAPAMEPRTGDWETTKAGDHYEMRGENWGGRIGGSPTLSHSRKVSERREQWSFYAYHVQKPSLATAPSVRGSPLRRHRGVVRFANAMV